jgi:hypothetical protein
MQPVNEPQFSIDLNNGTIYWDRLIIHPLGDVERSNHLAFTKMWVEIMPNTDRNGSCVWHPLPDIFTPKVSLTGSVGRKQQRIVVVKMRLLPTEFAWSRGVKRITARKPYRSSQKATDWVETYKRSAHFQFMQWALGQPDDDSWHYSYTWGEVFQQFVDKQLEHIQVNYH